MKRCGQCRGKLGLSVRARNLWNGRWWLRVRFCSTPLWSSLRAGAICGRSIGPSRSLLERERKGHEGARKLGVIRGKTSRASLSRPRVFRVDRHHTAHGELGALTMPSAQGS